MDTKNFEAFSRIALHLLIKLFESFPGYIEVDSNNLGKEAKPIDENEEYKNIWESKEFANDC